MPDWLTILIAIIGCLTGVISLIWNIINSLSAKKGKLKVVAEISRSDIDLGLGYPVYENFFQIIITNAGQSERKISRISVELWNKGREKRVIVKNGWVNDFRGVSLKYGDNVIGYINFDKFVSMNCDFFKIAVEDTLGKAYQSKTINYRSSVEVFKKLEIQYPNR